MDSSIPRSIILLVILVLAGGFFCAAETAINFVNDIRMRCLADNGDRRAKYVVRILDDFDQTVVTLIVIINIIQVATAALATVFFVQQLKMGNEVGSVVATAVMTIVIYIVSETFPKSIAKANADSFSLQIAGFIWFLRKLFAPFSFFFTIIGKGVKKLFGLDAKEPRVTEDELSLIVENVENEGLIEPEETKIIKSAIGFGDSVASSAMTPLDKVVGIPLNASAETIKNILINEKFSRFPVYRESPDDIVGVLQSANNLWKLANGKKLVLKDSMTKPYFVRYDCPLSDVFEGMCGRRCHFSAVIGENGKVVGILTMEDILEEIVGEIYDESDASVAEKTPEQGGDR